MKTGIWHRFSTGVLVASVAASAWSFNPSTQPPESSAVPGNVMLALSVEFPTGLQVSYTDSFSALRIYEGYFDQRKCYTYNTTNEFFAPASALSSTGTCATTEWSGNFLNWLTMTNLDQFRSVMTGGTRDNFSSMNATHPGDTVDRTILIRSFSDRNAYNPEKALRSTDPIPSALRSSTAKRARSGGYGSKLIISDDTTFPAIGTIKADSTLASQRSSCAGFTSLLGADDRCFNIRVEVCREVSSPSFVGREPNCRPKYVNPSTGAVVAKPEGLIHEYANNLRFGAFGYLNQDAQSRDGAVLRSAMKSVGPVMATNTGVTSNPNREWNATTGVMLPNPDPSDASDSSVPNSGLMNYLNKFGFAAGYKSFDPVSELYYAALRYLRGYALPSAYTGTLTDELKDGFPVITGTAHQRGGNRDPMINSCQKNFLLGIGDIYTHCDGNLPGSSLGLNSTCGSGTVSDPDGLNVATRWSRITTLEGSTAWTGGATSGTPYMAGLAHWAHTQDIRSDLVGTQTVATYWVDVLENGNGVGGMPNAGTLRTQFWLAAKYGGFDKSLAVGDDPNTRRATSTTLPWDTDGNGVPDNWFPGNNPTSLRNSLSSAFARISLESSSNSASSAAVTSSRQTSSSQIIYAGYDPKDWSGSLRACTPAQTAEQCASTPVWEASRWFKTSSPTFVATPLTSGTRKIFTSHQGANFTRMPFRWASLNTTQQGILNASDNLGSARLDYLRGSRVNEGDRFRVRGPNLLADIVNSGVTYLGGPLPALSGSSFPGHSTYRASTRTRPPVVYVGSNGGKLHAFSGVDGRELFAYIPGAVFANLPSLSALNFQHRYFVDSTPMVGDYQPTTTTWGTMLVGGLGAGGRGYYALNLTQQASFADATESTLSTLPMWEFTSAQDSDLGFTFNEPSVDPVTGVYRQIAKVADAATATGVWRVIVGNGYGSSAGRAALFMLNASTGVPTKLIAHTGPSNGLSSPTPVDTDQDGLIDTVYAGDLAGNMHKFQFSVLSGSNVVLARSGQSGAEWRYIGMVFSSGEPITTAPSVAPSCSSNGWNVAFGTGKLNEDPDYSDTARRGFYSVVDSGLSSSLTVSTNELATITYSTTSLGSDDVGRTWSAPNLTGRRGWKMFFTDGERVLTNATLPPDTGSVLFATTRPTGDVCSPGNTGFLMAVNLCSGRIGDLVIGDNVVTGGVSIDSTGVVKVSNTYTDSSNRPVVVCNQDDCKGSPPTLGMSVAPRGRYSWREILTK